MKKVVLVLIVLVGMVSVQEAKADNYFTIGGGKGGTYNAKNISVEFGKRSDSSLFALGFTTILNNEGISPDTDSTYQLKEGHSLPKNYSYYDEYRCIYDRRSDSSGNYTIYATHQNSRTGTLSDLELTRDIPEFGIYAKYGIEIIKRSGLFLTGIGGVTFADETHLYRFDETYRDVCIVDDGRISDRSYGRPHYYTEKEGWNVYALYGGGISYFVGDFCFQVDYDNRRGTTFSAGGGFLF